MLMENHKLKSKYKSKYTILFEQMFKATNLPTGKFSRTMILINQLIKWMSCRGAFTPKNYRNTDGKTIS